MILKSSEYNSNTFAHPHSTYRLYMHKKQVFHGVTLINTDMFIFSGLDAEMVRRLCNHKERKCSLFQYAITVAQLMIFL